MDLTTSYLGLTLKNPVVASAAPNNANLDHLRRLEDAGAAGVVLPSLFEEQTEAMGAWHDTIVAAGTGNNPEAHQHYLPPTHVAAGLHRVVPDRYLDLVRRARESLSIPVIASLNGTTAGDWLDYGRLLEEAGANALELNLYAVPTDLAETGATIEECYVQAVHALRAQLGAPLSVKMGPYFTNAGNMAQRFVETGAAGLTIFSRIVPPDINLQRLTLTTELTLSQVVDMRLSLQWIALLAGRIKASLAASTGVENTEQVIKYLYAGADVVMVTSAILRNGSAYLRHLVDGLGEWLEMRNVASPNAIRGLMSYAKLKNPEAYTRKQYVDQLQTWSGQYFDV